MSPGSRRARWRPRRRRGAVLLALGLSLGPLLGVWVTDPNGAGAQPDDPAAGETTTGDTTPATDPNAGEPEGDPVAPVATVPAEGSLQLLAQSDYVVADGEFSARLGWSGPVEEGLTVSLIVRGRISREGQLEATTNVLNRSQPVPLTSVVQADGSLLVNLPIRSYSPGLPGENRVWIDRAGVYPIDIEIRDAFGPIASLPTNLIRLPTELAEADLLDVTTVLPVSVADGIGIADATALLEAHPQTPITVLFETGVVPLLLDDPETSDRFRAALGTREVIVNPTLDLDPSALAKIGHGDLFAEAMTTTNASLAALGITPPATVIALSAPLTSEGAGLLRSLGIEIVFDLEGGTRGLIATEAGSLRVVSVDDSLTALLTDEQAPARAAHQLLARLALRNEDATSPVLIGGPALERTAPAGIEVFLGALDSGALLRALPLVEFARTGSAVPFRPIESPSQDLGPITPLLDRTLTLIDDYRTFYVGGALPPEWFRTGLLSALGRDRNPSDRLRSVAQIEEQVSEAFEVIEFRNDQSVTLTAQRLSIPLTIVNNADGDRAIRLAFDSDKVDVDEDGQVITVPPGVTSLDITIEARSLGLSPLGVSASTPDGARPLAETRIQVRSTAIPGLGLLLSGAALTFLICWWVLSIARSRADRTASASRESDGFDAEGAGRHPTGPAEPVAMRIAGHDGDRVDEPINVVAQPSTAHETSHES